MNYKPFCLSVLLYGLAQAAIAQTPGANGSTSPPARPGWEEHSATPINRLRLPLRQMP